MTKKQKKERNYIITMAVIFFAILIVEKTGLLEQALQTGVLSTVPGIQRWLFPVLYLIPYALLAWEILVGAFKNLFKGHVLDEDFLMAIATVAAFAIGECSEGVAATLFFRIGELFEDYAVNRSRQSIKDLMEIAPEYANVEVDGELQQVDPEDVEVGTLIIVKPGEKVPLDGIVEQGTSLLDTAALTGESVDRMVMPGDEIISGCINGNGLLHVRTTKGFEDSTVAKILELVEDASSQKAPVENFITKFAKYYTPLVVIVALALAIITPLATEVAVSEGIRRACIFLVVSCPCALVISVPLSFFGGIGAASRRGILVKGSNFMEAMAKTDTIVFDKTGTLTEGSFAVKAVWPKEKEEEVLKYAALCEGFSNHPIAASVSRACVEHLNLDVVSSQEELPGRGVKAIINGKTCFAGNEKLMVENGIRITPCQETGTVVYVSCESEFLGWILIADSIKADMKDSIERLHAVGIKNIVMLTGDREEIAEAVADEIGIDQVYSELLPADKVAKVQELLDKQAAGAKLAFAGDGINDAPVIMRSDVGIAMGSMGSDAAIEAADIVLMDDDISKIATIIKIARKTLRIANFNIVFAIGVKVVVLILGAVGIANMWLAIFADVGVAILAILNAMRTMRIK
ncbi:MAG: cadmium-translocating P-type ATPase [Eubacterium sp.]|nr:cadmium-translocating P-type ATPase [Eubacterium sp.]